MKFTKSKDELRRADMRINHRVGLDDIVSLIADHICEFDCINDENYAKLTSRNKIIAVVRHALYSRGDNAIWAASDRLHEAHAKTRDEAKDKTYELVLAFFPELTVDAPEHRREWGVNKKNPQT